MRSCLLLLALSCGTPPEQAEAPPSPPLAAAAAAPTPSYPRLAGIPVHTDDAAGLAPDAAAVLEAVSRIESERPEPPADDSLDVIQRWAETSFSDYTDRMRVLRAQLAERAQALARSERPADRHLAAIGVAYADDLYRARILASPIPRDFREDAELRGVYVGSLHRSADPLAREAQERYARCAEERAALAPAMGAWGPYCAERARALARYLATRPTP